MSETVIIISICVIGTLTLCWGGYVHLSNKISDILKALSDVEKKAHDYDYIKNTLEEIRVALVGDMDKKGWTTRVHDVEAEVESMKKMCEERHKDGHTR